MSDELVPSGKYTRWWKLHGELDSSEAPHSAALDALRRIYDTQSYRRQADRVYLRMFDDVRYSGFDKATGSSIDDEDFARDRLNDNVIKAIGLTIHSKLMKQKIRPDVVTEGGNWELQHQAELLDKYLKGLFEQCKADQLFSLQRMHGVATGTGFIKVFTRDGEPDAEVVPSWEIFIDASEARYGDPVSFYQFKAVDRERLKEMFVTDGGEGERIEALLEKAGTSNELRITLGEWDRDGASDMVPVFEAWHMPSAEDAGDGRHLIFTDNCTLANDEWKRMHPPLAAFRYSIRPMGYFGCGAIEDLIGQQIELSRTLATRQEALHLLGAPYVLMERGAKVVKSHWSNLVGRIIEYTGGPGSTPPQVISPSAINAEVFAHGDRVKQAMFEQARVSSLSATMQKPAGLNSGKALRTYADLESEGLVSALQNAEQSVLDFAELLLEESKEAAASGRAPTVTYLGDDGLEFIAWKDIKLERNKYKLKIAAASALSTTVAGKLEDLQDMRDLGIVSDPGEMRQLLGIPDLERHKSETLAYRDLLRKVIEKNILKEGQGVHPEPFWDHAEAMKIAVSRLMDAELRGAPKDRLDLLRAFIVEVQNFIDPSLNATPAQTPPETALPPPGAGNGVGLQPPSVPELSMLPPSGTPGVAGPPPPPFPAS